jgi:hypothetical protein
LALLAGVGSVVAIYLGSRFLRFGIYADAKALAIAAPLVMLAALYGVLDTRPAERRRGPTSLRDRVRAGASLLRDMGAAALRGDAARLGRAALGVAFVTAALVSTYLVLGGARVDRSDQGEDLARLRPELGGKRVLFLGTDEHAAFELGGAAVIGPYPLPRGPQLDLRPGVGVVPDSLRYDFDSVPRETLDWADLAITTRTPYTSEPPPNFRAVDSTESYVLWKRIGPTPARRTLPEGELPGAMLDCSTPQGRRLSGRRGVARIFAPQPAYRAGTHWVQAGTRPGVPVPAQTTEDAPVQQRLRLAQGRWEISFQYRSVEPLEVRAPGLEWELPPNPDLFIGPFWPAGTIEIERAGPVPFTVQVERRPALRRLLGAPGSPRGALLGAIAATPVGEPRRTVPLREACGRFVDWYVLR